MEQYVLENRWIINGNTLRYFGIRKAPYTNKNTVRLSNKEINAVNALICGSQEIKGKLVSRLIDEGILVRASEKRVTPKSLDVACFCKNCVANDFIIPGIEFVDGLCPMCISAKQNSGLIATLPIKQTFEKSKTSRFDIALFYTGGKDSTYLLLYFKKVLNLRVLALTWEIPFMSESARKSIENAKKKFRNVEFVNRYVAPNDLAKMYKQLLELQNNICACPSLAYVLFFPTLVAERVPYLVLGNEPVQMLGLYYNNMVPKITYRFKDMKTIHTLMNIGRLFQLKKPLKKGQFEMQLLIKQLVKGDPWIKKISGYKNELLNNIVIALKEIPHLFDSLKKTISYADRRAQMPSLIHFDMNQAATDGAYDWKKIAKEIADDAGWIAPGNDKLLHTSCSVEIAKDYSQFIRFYNMESMVIPFSAIEISLASASGNYSREDSIAELKNNLGFTLEQPDAHKLMQKCDGSCMSHIDL